MAVLGMIQRVAGHLYRDLYTGRFISWAEAKPVVEQATRYAYRRIAIRGNYAKAMDTIMRRTGLSESETQDIINKHRAAVRRWINEGRVGSIPQLTTP